MARYGGVVGAVDGVADAAAAAGVGGRVDVGRCRVGSAHKCDTIEKWHFYKRMTKTENTFPEKCKLCLQRRIDLANIDLGLISAI